jgi:SAM-dependent methyltransferase
MEKSDRYDHVASHCVCCGSVDLARSPAVLMPFIAHRIYQWEPVIIDESWGLNTIHPGHAYSLCNSLLCMACHLLFLDIRFSDAELSRLYRDYRGEAYTALRDRYEPGYKSRNDGLTQGINYLDAVEAFLTPHLPNTISMLDWGGDTGVNTPFKRDTNTIHLYDISGAETSGKIRKVSRQTAAQNRYDLVVCSNVLEHVPYPKDLLEGIKALMQPSTVLYLEVPRENLVRENPDAATLLRKKRHWHEHINFFSETALRALLREVGLSIVEFKVHDIVSEGVLHSQFMVACTTGPAHA